MKNNLLSLVLLFLGLASGLAQEIVLEMNPAIDTLEPKSGPNRKHYVHPLISFGFCADAGEKGATVNQPRVDQFSLGVRYKRRVAEHFALGWELLYNVNDFSLKQKSGKTLPDTLLYTKQRMIFYNAQGGLYMRFNFGRRGNTIGNYIDLAAYGDAVFAHTLYSKYSLPDNSVIRARRNKLDYFQRFNYGAQLRLGYKHMLLYGQYRISDLFYPSLNMAELPRITVGVQFILR
jgi:hypothetical protein